MRYSERNQWLGHYPLIPPAQAQYENAQSRRRRKPKQNHAKSNDTAIGQNGMRNNTIDWL
jgi:hypothetical protein